MNKNSKSFLLGIIIVAIGSITSIILYNSGYSKGYIQGTQYQPSSNQTFPLPQSQNNAIVWNPTGLYVEIEDTTPITTLNKCTHIVIEDVAGDYYFVRVEQNNVVIAYGWASNYDIRLYPDFSNGVVECDE
jgi:hypothetical protein